MLRNTVPNSSGVSGKFPTMIWIQSARWRPERAHSRCGKFHAMVMPSPYCEEAPPLIGEADDMQHPYKVNHCGKWFGVLLQNMLLGIWHDQNIRVSEQSKLSGHKGSTCLHWKLLPRPAVDTQHRMLWFVPVPSSTCIRATCGLIPCQKPIWSIHSASAIVMVVGLVLWGLLFSVYSIVIPLR